MWSQEQTDILRQNYGKIPADEIAELVGKTANTVRSRAFHLGLKSDLNRSSSYDKESLLSELEDLGYVPLNKIDKVGDKAKFKCKYCDNTFWTRPYRIKVGHTKSCGCVSIGRRTGGVFLSGDWMNRTTRGAKARNIYFGVSMEYLEDLLEKQEFKCALSGRELVFGYNNLNEYTASLDRIDSDKDYIEGNVQFLHKDVNMAKQSMSQQDFINMCREVTKNEDQSSFSN